ATVIIDPALATEIAEAKREAESARPSSEEPPAGDDRALDAAEPRRRAARASDVEIEIAAGEPKTAAPPAVTGATSEPGWPEVDRRVEVRRAADRGPGEQATPVAIDDDGWPLESAEELPPAAETAGAAEAREAPVAVAREAPVPQLPSPAAAAYEAARIVGEMVGDIASAPGAALVAAAAAGAAIEVTRARAAAGEPERPPVPPADVAGRDPVTTVRMQRERILRALVEDVAATTASAG